MQPRVQAVIFHLMGYGYTYEGEEYQNLCFSLMYQQCNTKRLNAMWFIKIDFCGYILRQISQISPVLDVEHMTLQLD